jgi:ectoine hydroxylase-related dioxygenase (phytanoyl-CoA dioxygenase family)
MTTHAIPALAPPPHRAQPFVGPVDQTVADRFHRDGFLSLAKLIDADTVAELRRLYDACVDGTLVPDGDRRMLGGVTRQVMFPSKYHAYFRDNPAIRVARAIGATIMGVPTTELCYDMLIDKPAGHPKSTPWHQDMSYTEEPVAHTGKPCYRDNIQFWIALDDVDVDNGCMQYYPGIHYGTVLPHHVASGDPKDQSRLLAMDDPARDCDMAKVVACPLPAGGCSLHAYGTPHYTGPNLTTNRNRRAYIINVMPPGGPR